MAMAAGTTEIRYNLIALSFALPPVHSGPVALCLSYREYLFCRGTGFE
jgi:hypothetical protein